MYHKERRAVEEYQAALRIEAGEKNETYLGERLITEE